MGLSVCQSVSPSVTLFFNKFVKCNKDTVRHVSLTGVLAWRKANQYAGASKRVERFFLFGLQFPAQAFDYSLIPFSIHSDLAGLTWWYNKSAKIAENRAKTKVFRDTMGGGDFGNHVLVGGSPHSPILVNPARWSGQPWRKIV